MMWNGRIAIGPEVRDDGQSVTTDPRDAIHSLMAGAWLIGVILIVFGQMVWFDFLLWDDPLNIVDDAHVRNGLTLDNLVWAFKGVARTHWQPLTTLSHMLDVSLFGMRPGGHHATSLVLHILNTLLVFAVLQSMTGARWRSAFVAALFALHPLHVEPVAWASARRDVLSTLFGLLSMLAYVSYAKRGGIGRYALVALLVVLALLAKSMLVTLPLAFLVLDYWPLCRVRIGGRDNGENTSTPQRTVACQVQSIKRVVLEKIPLLVLSMAFCLVAIVMLKNAGEVEMVGKVPFHLRAANAVVSYVVYIEKVIWPARLSPHYVHPNLPGGTPWAPWQIIGAGLVLIAISGLVVRANSRRYLVAGWLWYLGMLVPVIGFVQVGKPGMADRYTYVSVIGLFIIVAWGGLEVLGGWSERRRLVCRIGPACAIVVIAACMARSHWQAQHWRNSLSFFTYAVDVSPTNAYLQNNYGIVLLRQGRHGEAVDHFRRALEIMPDFSGAHTNLGMVLQMCGRYGEAFRHYREAQRIDSASPAARKHQRIPERDHLMGKEPE
jgi:hypothetical protein